MDLQDHVVDNAARMAANWRKFESFGWSGRPDDAELWTIYHTDHRDSDALARSNAHVITEALKPWTGLAEDGDDVESQSFGHWAVGHVNALVVRVYRADGTITEAFAALSELLDSLEDYPSLDDDYWSQLESDEATEYWEHMSVSMRVEYLQRADLCIFAARRSEFPCDDNGRLQELLNSN